jgi:hypothetical protein
MHHPARRGIVRERIILAEVMKLERRQARERAADAKPPLTGAREVRAERAERRS